MPEPPRLDSGEVFRFEMLAFAAFVAILLPDYLTYSLSGRDLRANHHMGYERTRHHTSQLHL